MMNATTERSSLFNPMSPEFVAIGKKRIESMIDAQTELLEALQGTSQHCLDRLQSEANLVSELTSKLTAARSTTDTAAAYQEWVSRRMDLIAEDGKHLLADTQKIMHTGARLLSSGWLSDGSSAGNT